MLFQQSENRSKVKRGNKGHGQFVITGGNPAKKFQFIEETLHQIPLLVGMKVARPGVSAILLGWYKEYILCSYLAKQLPSDKTQPFDLDNRVKLKYYRLEKTYEGAIELEATPGS